MPTHDPRQPSSFRSAKDQPYADAYMMDHQLAGDRRKLRIDALQQGIVGDLIARAPRGGLVADVPCGNGRMTQLAERPDLRVLAMDFNMSMLRAMAKRGGGAARALRLNADVTRLPLPDKCVDLFINMRLMHHIADRGLRVHMYREIVRVTRGVVVSSFWSNRCWRHLRKRVLFKTIRGYPVSPRQFLGVCREAGLAVERIVPVRRFYEEECVVIARPGV